MTNNDPIGRVDESCRGLREVKRFLADAAGNVENHMTKERIEGQLKAVEGCLSECENIFSTLKKQ